MFVCVSTRVAPNLELSTKQIDVFLLLTRWDTQLPFVGGLPWFRSLLKSFSELDSYCEFLVEANPVEWNVEEQDEALPVTMGCLGESAPYSRGHHIRTMALLAICFGAVHTPLVTPRGWGILCSLLSGTGKALERLGLHYFENAMVLVETIDSEVTRRAPGVYMVKFDLWDLSCALCLAGGGMGSYHKDEELA